jgi:hypothetical protein
VNHGFFIAKRTPAMNTQHRYLPLHKVTDGMVLADDLLDKVGHVLLPAGVVLNEKMIHAIAHHDILQISIVVDALSDEEQQAQQEQQLARVDHVFRRAGHTSPDCILYRYVRHYRTEQSNPLVA